MSVITSAELFRIGELSADLGYQELGISLLEHLLEHVPAHVAGHCLLGEQLLALERWLDAQEHFDLVLRVCPLNLSALRGMGRVALAQGLEEQAAQHLRMARALYPSDPQSRQLLGEAPPPVSALGLARALSACGRHAEAVRYYEAALDRTVDQPAAQPIMALLTAEALWSAGEPDRARPLLEELASQKPSWVRPKLILADIALGQHEDSLGVALLHDASAVDSSLLVAQELFGENERYRLLLQESPGIPGPAPELLESAPHVVRYLLGLDPLPDPVALEGSTEDELCLSGHSQDLHRKSRSASGTGRGFAELAYLRPAGEALGEDVTSSVPGQVAPVRVILSSREALTAKYGDDGYRELDARLSDLREATAESTGHDVIKVYVDDPACLSAYGLETVDPSQPHQVRGLIQQLGSKLTLQTQKLQSLLIVGGDSVLPFHRLANPTDDEDGEILSDWPYAVRDGNPLLAQFSIGRLPDGPSSDADTLLKLVENAIAHHSASCTGRNQGKSRTLLGHMAKLFGSKKGTVTSVGYSAEVWAEAARAVFQIIGDAKSLKVSPPLTDYDFLSMYERVPTLAYFNLHGFDGSPYWYGHGESEHGSPLLPVALTPLSISYSDAEAAVVYTEACYGAATGNGSVDASIALSFLAKGALGFIGATAMSYGSLEPPLSGADLLGKYVWEGVLGGLPIGCALRRARLAFIQAASSKQGYLDGEDQKTLLSFVLYGDPALSFDGGAPSPELEAEVEVCWPPMTCRHKMLDSEPLGVSSELREKVQRHLPLKSVTDLRARRLIVCTGTCPDRDCVTSACGAEPKTDRAFPELIVTSAQRDVSKGGNHLQHVIKVTVNQEGDVTKVLMSRGGIAQPGE